MFNRFSLIPLYFESIHERVSKWDNFNLFKIIFNICLVLSLLMFLNIIWNSFYVRPFYDDLGLLEMSRRHSSFEMMRLTYFDLTGRFAFIWVVTAFMHACGDAVQWFIFGALFLWMVCWMVAFAKRGTALYALGLLTTIVVVCVVITPSPSNSIYWFSAAANILPALILLPLLVPLRRIRSWLGAVLGWALGFLMAGFQEQAAMVVGCAILFLLIRDWHHSKRATSTWGALSGFVFGAVVLLASPGNAARAAREAALGHHLPTSRALQLGFEGAQNLFTQCLPHLGLRFPSWLDMPSPYFIWTGAPIFWVFLAAACWGYKTYPTQSINWKKLVLIGVAGWTLCTVMMVLSVLATRQPPWAYPRIYFVPAFVVASTFSLLGFYARALMRNPPLWLVFCLFISLISSFGALRGIVTMSNSMRHFAEDWDKQDATLEALRNSGVKDVELEPVGKMWTSDKTNWLNKSVADYYRLRSISTPAKTGQ